MPRLNSIVKIEDRTLLEQTDYSAWAIFASSTINKKFKTINLQIFQYFNQHTIIF